MAGGHDGSTCLKRLDTTFQISARGSTLSRELLGALATFLTLSYILFVQPAVMSLTLPDGTSQAGREAFAAGVLAAVCLASALACFLMGILANLPVALAPAMGHNFFFALCVCGPVATGGLGFTWSQALAANLIAGLIFLALSLAGYLLPRFDPRRLLFGAIPPAIQSSIGVGIGILIAMVGFEYAGIVTGKPGTYVGLGLGKIPWKIVGTALIGLLAFGACWVRRISGAPLLAIAASAIAGLALGVLDLPESLVALPDLSATAFRLDFSGLFESGAAARGAVIAVATFLFLDMFDTVGTLAGVCRRTGISLGGDGSDRKIGGAFVADAAGTVAGAALGTSTITSYIESLAGVAAGARTGLAAIGVGVLFLAAMFFQPVFSVVAAPVSVQLPVGFAIPGGGTASLYPCLAPVLIGIGAVMMACIRDIDWEDPTEALPAFLCIMGMAFTVSITDGIAFGFISHVVVKAAAGRFREIRPFVAVCAALLLLRYAFELTG
ncbi:MAG: NCS2 family permease [Planctomycetota bacterium]|nr:NCS2 family permease [Planctomycetota bacterium]